MKKSGKQMVAGSWLLWLLVVAACQDGPTAKEQGERGDPVEMLPPEQEMVYLQRGDSLATAAQGALMANVVAAIGAGGVSGAVDFCSERAIPLTDSVSHHFDVGIRRLTDKNRNPENLIQSAADSIAWQELQVKRRDTLQRQKHLVLQADGGQVYYYKAISIAMPTCLKCHGNVGTDIDADTWKVIRDKYPADKAVGYQLGDLRGMWKIHIASDGDHRKQPKQ